MNIFRRFVAYIRNAQAELQKVSWPTKEDLTRYTSLIIAVTVISAVFFTALDGALNNAVSSLITRRQPAAAQNTNPILPEDALQPSEVQVETATSTGNPITGAPSAPNPITNQ